MKLINNIIDIFSLLFLLFFSYEIGQFVFFETINYSEMIISFWILFACIVIASFYMIFEIIKYINKNL